MKNNGIGIWLRDNAWSLIVTLIAIAMTFATLSGRVTALESRVNEYPSQDYFELRFEVIEKGIEENSILIKELGRKLGS